MARESEGWHHEEYWHRPDFMYRQGSQASNKSEDKKEAIGEEAAKDAEIDLETADQWRNGFVVRADGTTIWARE